MKLCYLIENLDSGMYVNWRIQNKCVKVTSSSCSFFSISLAFLFLLHSHNLALSVSDLKPNKMCRDHDDNHIDRKHFFLTTTEVSVSVNFSSKFIFICKMLYLSYFVLYFAAGWCRYLTISPSPFNKLIKMKFAIWSTCCNPLNLVQLAALVCCRFSHVLRQR